MTSIEKGRGIPNRTLPAVITIATTAQKTTVEIAKMATDSAPIYIAVTKAKNRAKNPPATAKEIRRETKMAFIVAARKKSIKTTSPERATRATVPTCINYNHKSKSFNIIVFI